MKIVITGASGLIGSALIPALREKSHEITRLVRRPATAPDEVSWNPAAGVIDDAALSGADAVIHLAGAGVGDHRWTDAYKQEIVASRVDGTRTIATAMARLPSPPKVLLSASAIGWYGDTGTTPVDETAAPGTGFLADVAHQWEDSTAPLADTGVRVVRLRTGLVAAVNGGAFHRMLPLFRLGLGGRLGAGTQFWSLISLADEIRAIDFLLTADTVSGPVNLTGPEPTTNAEVTTILGHALGKPTALPVPAFALRLALGEFATEILTSTRVLPARLQAAGFTFAYPTTEAIIGSVVGR
jgi:uncharacterized protein